MTIFAECDGTQRIIIGIISIFLVFGAIQLINASTVQKRYGRLVLTIPVLLCSFLMMECVLEYEEFLYNNEITDMSPGKFEILETFSEIPYITLVFLCIICMAAEIGEWINIIYWGSNHISPISVKEAIDSMPAGVCSFRPDGRLLLVNRAMESFGRKVTGNVITDGAGFERCLAYGSLMPGCSRVELGGKQFILTDDGNAYSVSTQYIKNEDEVIRLLTVSDMTEEYRKHTDLLEYQNKVRELNERLTKYNSEIVALTSDREVLNAKVKIHDEMGSGLLAIKHYLKTGGTVEERENIIERLRRNIAFLQHAPQENVIDEYSLMIGTAGELGVFIEVEGELPQEEPMKHIVATAIHECLTNTLRHAKGDRISVYVSESGDEVEVTLKNNGIQPEEEIVERGGLASLRTLTEQSGGKMTVLSVPEFAVVLSLPKGELIYGI